LTLPGNNSKTKVARTPELLAACTDPDVKKALTQSLDPDGWHVMTKHFYHDSNHKIRTLWLVKAKGREEKQLALVDIEPKDLDTFPNFEDVHKFYFEDPVGG
jgi:hypothetical protein